MSGDYLLRQQFITNPMQILSEYVYGTQVPAEQAFLSNRLVYAALSSQQLRVWLHEYAATRRDQVPAGREFVSDFAQAVVEQGAHHVILALATAATGETRLAGFDEDILHWLLNLPFLNRQNGNGETGDTGDTGETGDTGTGITGETGDTGTGITGDTGTGVTGITGITDITGITGITDITGTGTLTAITFQTFITQTGTDTGPVTDPFTRSPFTHTESPGTGIGFTGGILEFAPAYVMVTLDELSTYAARLADSGALDG
jgi:hypothetical protein